MPLYLAATPDRLPRARAVTPRLAHVAYRLGPGSELLAAPLPPALRRILPYLPWTPSRRPFLYAWIEL